ncbi:hypothetical protein ACH0CA_01490 [Kytococcus sedentarius]
MAVNEFKMRLVAHDPKTHKRLGVLPDPLSVDIGLPRLDVTTAQVSYPLAGVRSELVDRRIEDGLCVSIQVAHATKYGPQDWTELPGGYMVLHSRSTDPSKATGDGGQVMDCQLMSYVAYHLNGAMLRPSKSAKYDSDGKRQFLSATPGAIMLTFIQELQRRGELAGVEAGFTATRDSNGKPWEKVVTLAVSEGEVDALTMLRSLADQGACDWTVDGRTLRMVNMDGDTRDLSVGRGSRDPVRLVIGTDVADAPQTESVESLVQEILVIGEGGKTELITDPTAPSPYGKRSAVVTQGGVSDTGTMRSLGAAQLKKLSMIESELTRELLLHDPRQLPMIDYKPGDWVTGPGPDGKAARLRVAQVTLQVGSEGDVASGHVILGTRKLDLLLRMTRRMVGITGGSKADGGSGVRPAPGGPDKRVPATPGKPSLSSEAYTTGAGNILSTVTAEWGEVSTDVNGVPMEVGGYEAQWRYVDAANPKSSGWRAFYSGDRTDYTRDRYSVSTRVAVRVRAQGPVKTSAWSPEAVITTAHDDVPPPIPSKPILTANLGVITVFWDGNGENGQDMPLDFRRVEVAVMDATSMDPAAPQPSSAHIWDRLDRMSTSQITGRKGIETFVRLRAVDTSGNKSEWSEESVITAENRVDVDEIWGVINDPDMLGPDLIHEKHIVASESLWAKLGKFVQIDAGMLNANEIWADDAWLGHARAQVLQVGAADPRKIGWSGDDLAPNPVWMDPDLRAAFPENNGWAYRTPSSGIEWAARPGQTHVLWAGASSLTGSARMSVSTEYPVAPGDKIGLEFDAARMTVTDGWNVELQAVPIGPTGTPNYGAAMKVSTSNSTPGGVITTFSATGTVPEGTRGIVLSVVATGTRGAGGWGISRISARKGMTAGGATGEGMEILPRGIRSWDANGEDVLRLGVSENALVVADTFRTGTRNSGPQVMLSNTISDLGLPGLHLSTDGSFGNKRASVYLRNGPLGSAELNLRSEMDSEGVRRRVYAEGTLAVGVDGASTPGIVMHPAGNIIFPQTGNPAIIRSQNETILSVGYDTDSNRGGIYVDRHGTGARVKMPNVAGVWTTSSPANVHISPTGGYLYMSTSLRAAKVNIQTYKPTASVLDVEPVTFYDRGESERRAEWLSGEYDGQEEPPVPRRIVGVVAEQVEAAGLGEYITRHEDGTPAGVAYDRMWLSLIPIIREQRDQIAALTARIEALEAA